jgi:hypothetical protein
LEGNVVFQNVFVLRTFASWACDVGAPEQPGAAQARKAEGTWNEVKKNEEAKPQPAQQQQQQQGQVYL